MIRYLVEVWDGQALVWRRTSLFPQELRLSEDGDIPITIKCAAGEHPATWHRAYLDPYNAAPQVVQVYRYPRPGHGPVDDPRDSAREGR